MADAYKAKTGGSVSATDVQGSVDLKFCKHLLLVNDGSNSVYIVIQQTPGSVTNVAATTDFQLKSGESWIADSELGFAAFLYICASGQTATVRYSGWH